MDAGASVKTPKKDQNVNIKDNHKNKKNINKNSLKASNKKVDKIEENNKKTKDKIHSKDKNTKSASQPQQGQPKKSGLKPVESKKKEKKIVPTRAANDPRYKS